MNYYPQIERKLDPTGFGIYRPVGNRLSPLWQCLFCQAEILAPSRSTAVEQHPHCPPSQLPGD